MNKPLRIVLVGPPGIGKGLLAEWLVKKYKLFEISCGDILREYSLKKELRRKMIQGKLLPLSIVWPIIKQKILECYNSNFILEGFPRTKEQATRLINFLKKCKLNVNYVFVLNSNLEIKELVNLVRGRRICEKCGKYYHRIFGPPKKTGRCDICGGKLVIRADDKRSTLFYRIIHYNKNLDSILNVFKEEKIPVYQIDVNFYDKQSAFKQICKTID